MQKRIFNNEEEIIKDKRKLEEAIDKAEEEYKALLDDIPSWNIKEMKVN